jgi:hypothetical protein
MTEYYTADKLHTVAKVGCFTVIICLAILYSYFGCSCSNSSTRILAFRSHHFIKRFEVNTTQLDYIDEADNIF